MGCSEIFYRVILGYRTADFLGYMVLHAQFYIGEQGVALLQITLCLLTVIGERVDE